MPHQSLIWLLLWTKSIAQGGYGDICDPEVEPVLGYLVGESIDHAEHVRGALVMGLGTERHRRVLGETITRLK